MYQIKCDDYPILDLRDERFIVVSPKCKLEVNTVGSASFTIYNTHPYYGELKKLKSIFEISDEIGVIFRGRMTNDTLDFDNGKAVDLEGLMAFFNDSIVPSYSFPDDWLEDEDYITASESGNVIEFFLKWLIDNHNSQVQDFQQFKLGNVTVTDSNNYLSRSETDCKTTWESLKSKLFDSALGGYLCIRYEDDGNYIDYLSEFELTNTQGIEFGENLLDLKHNSDATETYSAIIPIGAEIEVGTGETDENGNAITKKVKLSLASVEDGAITDEIFKVTLPNGLHALYSKKAVEDYGWICAPISESKWDDVTELQNLLNKSVECLGGKAVMLSDTIEVAAADLHFTDAEIRSFRIYRKIPVTSKPHGINEVYDLTKLDIDLMNAQNTKITAGETRLTLTDQNHKEHADTVQRIESAEKDIDANRAGVTETKEQIIIQGTSMINTCNELIMSAFTTFTETGDYSSFKETVEAQLILLSKQIELKFTETIRQIENVNGDLQEKFNKITKYFSFNINGLEIGSVDEEGNQNPFKVIIDNDRYSMLVNGQEVLWLDPDGQSNIPSVSVTTMLNLLGYVIDEDASSGTINCGWGGDS